MRSLEIVVFAGYWEYSGLIDASHLLAIVTLG